MKEFLNSYKEFLVISGKSENTVESYLGDIKKYDKFITEKHIDGFRDSYCVSQFIQYMEENNISQASIERAKISLRNFYKFLVMKKLIEAVPTIPKSKNNKNTELTNILTIEEITKLISSVDKEDKKSLRDRAILELMYGSGIKPSEVLSLKKNDVNLERDFIVCSDNKGFERILPLGKEAKRSIEKYLKSRDKNDDNEVLFVNANGNKLTRQGLWRIVKERCSEANINKDINLNTLRHSFALHLLQNGANPKSVQQLLGNNVMTYLEKYFNYLNKDRLNQVYKNTHPRA